MGTTAPSFFEPIFGKTAPERSEHGEGTAGRASGALPFGRLQRRHQPRAGVCLWRRDTVNALRRESVPIASNGSGYFYAATEQEVRATIAHLTNRIGGIAAAIRGLTRSLDVFDTAQTRLPLEGGDGS